jgi:hypothetical protein
MVRSLAVCGAVILVGTAVMAVDFLFTSFSQIPPVALSVLAMIAVCFAYARELWIRAGGLIVAVACASVTILPFWTALALPFPAYDLAWHYFDGLFGLEPGTVKPIYTGMMAVMLETVGIGFVYLSGQHGQRLMQAPAHAQFRTL